MSAKTYEPGRSVPSTPGGGAGQPAAFPPGPVVKVCGLTRVKDVFAAYEEGAWAVGFIFAASPRRLTPSEARELLVGAQAAIAAARESGGELMGRPAPFPSVAPLPLRERRGPLTVGVFVDENPEEIAAVARYVGLDAVQLHGPSAPAPAAIRKALGGWEPPFKLVAASGADARRPLVSAGAGTAGADPSAAPPIIKAVCVAVDERDAPALRRRLQEAGGGDALLLVDAGVAGCLGGTGRELPWEVVGKAAAGMRFLLAGGIRPDNVREALTVSGAWGVDVSSGVESAPGRKDGEALRRLLANVNDVRHTRHTPCEGEADEAQEGAAQ